MTIKLLNKPVAVNPFKLSQALGGTLAFQGLFRSLPIIHGSQGCAAFIKSLMTRHYQEPIAIQTSALQEMNVIFGAESAMIEALDTVIAKHDPEIIGVLSTALTEVAGDDMAANVQKYQRQRQIDNKLIVPVCLPDFYGSLESGYSKTVEAIISRVFEQGSENLNRERVTNQINLLAGSHLTPGDVMEVKDILSSFGFEVIAVPDLATSLSGHLTQGYSPLTRGGISLEKLKQIGKSQMTIAIGSSMERSAQIIEEHAGIPYQLFPSLTGLKANDKFFSFLQSLSGKTVPLRYRWQRENLLDCMLDAHFYYAGCKAVVALEPDHLYSIMEWLKEMGVTICGLVSSMAAPLLKKMAEEVAIGDLFDLENMAGGTDLWISNSHGKQGAARKGVPFFPTGLPLFEQIGSSLMTSVGYRGTTELVIKVGNILIERGHEKDESSICN